MLVAALSIEGAEHYGERYFFYPTSLAAQQKNLKWIHVLLDQSIRLPLSELFQAYLSVSPSGILVFNLQGAIFEN